MRNANFCQKKDMFPSQEQQRPLVNFLRCLLGVWAQHDMVEFHCSVLYESHKMSYDYLKSMVNSAIQWSQLTSKADSNQAERRRRYCSRSVGLR